MTCAAGGMSGDGGRTAVTGIPGDGDGRIESPSDDVGSLGGGPIGASVAMTFLLSRASAPWAPLFELSPLSFRRPANPGPNNCSAGARPGTCRASFALKSFSNRVLSARTIASRVARTVAPLSAANFSRCNCSSIIARVEPLAPPVPLPTTIEATSVSDGTWPVTRSTRRSVARRSRVVAGRTGAPPCARAVTDPILRLGAGSRPCPAC